MDKVEFIIVRKFWGKAVNYFRMVVLSHLFADR